MKISLQVGQAEIHETRTTIYPTASHEATKPRAIKNIPCSSLYLHEQLIFNLFPIFSLFFYDFWILKTTTDLRYLKASISFVRSLCDLKGPYNQLQSTRKCKWHLIKRQLWKTWIIKETLYLNWKQSFITLIWVPLHY